MIHFSAARYEMVHDRYQMIHGSVSNGPRLGTKGSIATCQMDHGPVPNVTRPGIEWCTARYQIVHGQEPNGLWLGTKLSTYPNQMVHDPVPNGSRPVTKWFTIRYRAFFFISCVLVVLSP